MGKFGLTEKYAAPTAPATGGSRFGLSSKYTPGTGDVSSFEAQTQGAAYQSAQQKLKTGGLLSAEEAAAVARVKSDQQTMSVIGAALQPLLAPSDIIKGVASDVKSDINSGTFNSTQAGGNSGMAAAVSHLTFGLAERLPGLAGARANGVTGADLLKGTKYEGNATGALMVELLTDPSLVLGGAGLALKGAGMAGKYASLARFAQTANGANVMRDIASVANRAGGRLLQASDAATGIPGVIKAAGVPLPKVGGLVAKVLPEVGADIAAGGVAGGMAGGLSRLADKTLPTGFQRALGVRTIGDAFYTPDVKAASFTPAQKARDAFRDTTRLNVDDLATAVTRSAVDDALNNVAKPLTQGLKTADAAEVTRLYGVLGTTTDPAIAAEVFNKVRALGTTLGRDLETPMVQAYKATARIDQQALGANLAARNLPAVIDPAVNKAIQAAQSGDDLLPHIGAIKSADGRPRGVLMTQYQGRGNLDQTIGKLEAAPQVPASTTIDAPKVAGTLDNAAAALPEIPPAPMAPVGVRPAAAPPSNPAETLDRILSEPGVAKTAVRETVPPAPAAPPAPMRGPAEVLDELSGGKVATRAAPEPLNVANPEPADLFSGAKNTAPITSDLPLGGKATPAPRATEPVPADQLQAWYGEEAGKVLARATPEDLAALKTYAGADFRATNTLLRDPAGFEAAGYTAATRASAEQTIKGLDEALSRYTIQQPLTVYRGIGGDYGLELYRAAKAGELTDARLVDNSFASTSISRQTADEFGKNVVLQIDVPAGARGMPLHRMAAAGEQELLFSRGTQYQVTGVEQQGKQVVIQARMQPPELNTAGAGTPPLAGKTRYLPADAAERPPQVRLLDAGAALGGKTPAEVLDAVLNPVRPQAGYAAPADLARTPQAELKTVSNVVTPPEQLVNKAIPTTYRTVSIDPSALDWGSLPDLAARRAVANVLGGELTRTATGGFKYSRDLAEVPLSHPVISTYFDDATLEGARFPGSGYGERTISRQQVPDWYDPKGAPLDVQRGERAASLNGAPVNDLAQMERTANELNTGQMDEYIVGNAYVESLRAGKPLAPTDLPRATNDYSQRVIALNGRPATPAELFQYRQQLARYNQQARLRTVTGDDVTTHLTDYFARYPEGTLFDAVNSAAKQFGLGRGGAMHLQDVLRTEESGFVRQMSSQEQAQFAQYLKAGQRSSVPGGTVTSRMLRNPEAVSSQFRQVFAQEIDGLKLLDEQIQRGVGAITQAEQQLRYHEYLTQTGQHFTARQITALNARPAHLLTPEEKALQTRLSYATEESGKTAGWKLMDREYGPFKVGDAVPWWAYHDIFHASSVADAAVSAAITNNGGLRVWDRSFAALNATRLSSPSSIITDQVGQLMQMVMYGVTPDEILNGMIQRAIAKPGALDAMRESGGIASAKLESNLGVDGAQLQALARKLAGDTDLTRMQRVVDSVLRYNEFGTGVDRAALSNPAARVASDVTHFGSAKLFQVRSAMSDLQRESLYFHYLSTGMTPKAAGAAANEVLLDMRLAPAYARVVSKWWPFFRWIAMSGPRSIVNVLRKPSITYAWNRSVSLSDTATEDGRNDARRTLTRPTGMLFGTAGNEWLNVGAQERDGSRVYLNATNWSPNNTIPQLLDLSGTKLGVVTLPDFITIPQAIITGTDRNGQPVYRQALDGKPGGFSVAEANDPGTATREAAMYLLQQFQPSYAPGSTRARQWADSVVQTAKLPADGSKDISIAQTIMAVPGGRAMLNYLQHGPAAWGMMGLDGNRGSKYSSPPSSLAVSSLKYLLPLQTVQVDQHQQGTAAAALNIGLLDIQNWKGGEVKRLQQMQAGGASPQVMQAERQQAARELQRRQQRLNATNLVTK